MQFGRFDDAAREYVISRPDTPLLSRYSLGHESVRATNAIRVWDNAAYDKSKLLVETKRMAAPKITNLS